AGRGRAGGQGRPPRRRSAQVVGGVVEGQAAFTGHRGAFDGEAAAALDAADAAPPHEQRRDPAAAVVELQLEGGGAGEGVDADAADVTLKAGADAGARVGDEGDPGRERAVRGSVEAAVVGAQLAVA